MTTVRLAPEVRGVAARRLRPATRLRQSEVAAHLRAATTQLVERMILGGAGSMIDLWRGRLYRWRVPNVVFVTLLGVVIGAGATSGVSTAVRKIPTPGPNLIVNPDFDTGVAGWTPQWFTMVDADAKNRGWSASVKWAHGRDYEGHPDSGSLELAITAAEGRCVSASQRVVVGPGTYVLMGNVFIHATEVHTEGAVVDLEVFWVDRSDSTMRLTRWSVDPTTARTGRWTQIVDPSTFTLGAGQFDGDLYGGQGQVGLISVPEGTRGAHLSLSACVSGYSTSPETVVADFDHLKLRAIPPSNHARALDSSRRFENAGQSNRDEG